MSHDKIRAAARQRMAETGEPYAAARRAVVSGHQAVGGRIPPPGAGCALRMSGEIHDWLADLHRRDQPAAARVGQALAALMEEGGALGDPLVVSTADSWPWALASALDRSYQESLERLQVLRQGEAEAATLARDIRDQVAELESAQSELEEVHRRALAAGRPQQAAEAAGELAAARQQAAEVRRLLPGVIQAGQRLASAARRRQERAEAFRVQKEVLKASYVAASGSLRVRAVIAAWGLAADDSDRRPEDSGEAISAAEARLGDVTAQMERELGQEPWPEGLMELRPGAPDEGGIRILFAVEPPGAALLIAVAEGLEGQYLEAVLAAADMLRQVRAGQAPGAAAYAYGDTRSFLAEFSPGGAGAGGSPP